MKKMHILKEDILVALKSIKEGNRRKQAAKILKISERTLQKNMNLHDITIRDWKPKDKELPKRHGWGANKLNIQNYWYRWFRNEVH